MLFCVIKYEHLDAEEGINCCIIFEKRMHVQQQEGETLSGFRYEFSCQRYYFAGCLIDRDNGVGRMNTKVRMK